jgi:KaiC/GvpD/RAD55 family RecA-like ATPase
MSGRPNIRTEDQLPPHSVEAERGIVGAVLYDSSQANDCLKRIEERFGTDAVFYDLRHALILSAMFELRREGLDVDLITVSQRLRDRNELDSAGGYAGLNELANESLGTGALTSYLEIVWEKYLSRDLLQTNGRINAAIMEQNGVNELTLARVKRFQDEFEHKTQRGAITPKYLKSSAEFAEGFYSRFFGGEKGEPGLELPIHFPLKIRRQETTLFSGDDKAGKSTLLSYFALHLAAQGEKVCLASFEMPPDVSLWMLASQLMGRKHMPDSEQGRRQVALALAWLNQHFWFYDFLGISDWRDVLDTFRYAASKHGVSFFLLDSVMRIGIPDDDYAQQGLAAAQFANFAMENDAHLAYVIHENKADNKGKSKIRGSKLWSANANNIVQVRRNLEKGDKASKLEWDIRNEKMQGEPDQAEINRMEQELELMKKDWDSHMALRGQRYPGSQQNGSKFFWFDNESFQFRNNWQDTSVNWLEQWRKRTERNG